jgi:hypothetical protein
LYFGSVSLLLSALLLTVSTIEKRPEPRLHLPDRPRKVGQLTSDQRDVLPGCHFALQSKEAAGSSSAGLRGERHGSRPGEFQGEPTEDGQVSVEADALDATDAEHRQRVMVLQPSELALDG